MTGITVPVSTIITVTAKCGGQPGLPESAPVAPGLVAGKGPVREFFL